MSLRGLPPSFWRVSVDLVHFLLRSTIWISLNIARVQKKHCAGIRYIPGKLMIRWWSKLLTHVSILKHKVCQVPNLQAKTNTNFNPGLILAEWHWTSNSALLTLDQNFTQHAALGIKWRTFWSEEFAADIVRDSLGKEVTAEISLRT